MMKKPLITCWRRRATVFRSRFVKGAENGTTTNRLSTQGSEKIECKSSKCANTFEWKMNCFLCGDKRESKKNFL